MQVEGFELVRAVVSGALQSCLFDCRWYAEDVEQRDDDRRLRIRPDIRDHRVAKGASRELSAIAIRGQVADMSLMIEPSL